MKTPLFYRRRQRSAVFVTLLLFELILVLVQLWLLVSALDGVLSGRVGMAGTAAIVSLGCLAINTWMLVGVYRVDHER